MIWFVLILGLPPILLVFWNLNTPENFFRYLAIILMTGIPVYIALTILWDWAVRKIRKE